MAIDPTISLQAGANQKSFDLGGIFKTGLDIQQGQQNLALGEQKRQANEIALRYADPMAREALGTAAAGTQSAQLKAEQEARELAAKKVIAGLAKKYSTTDAKTGRIMVDHQAIADEGSMLGLDPQTVLGYSTKASEQAQGRIKTADEATTWAQKQFDIANNLIRNADPVTAANIAHSTIGIVSSVMDPVMGKGSAGNFATKAFNMPVGPDGAAVPPPTDPKTGKADLAVVGTHLKQNAGTWAQSTISPQQAVSNAQTEESLRQGREAQAMTGAQTGVAPTDRSPTSTSTKAAYAQLEAAGLKPPPGLSKAELMANPQFSGVLGATVISSGGKEADARDATKLRNNATMLGELAAAADKIGSIGLTPAQALALKVGDKLLNDPNVQNYRTRVQMAKDAGIPITEAGPQGVANFARGQARTLEQQAVEAERRVREPTFRQTTGPGAAPAPAPAAAGPKFGTTKNHGGKTYIYQGGFPGGEQNFKNWKER